MAFFEWNEMYSVGIKAMDQEHQKLFGIMNKIYDALKIGKGSSVMEDVLKELFDYTDFHFTDEEKLMKDNSYSGLSEQENQHKIFEKKIKEFQENQKSGRMLVSVDTMNFLKDWLVNHIQKFDKAYGTYLNGKGIH